MKERAPKRLESDALWAYALKLLSGRARSSGELRQKLRLRAQKADDIDPLLVRLKELGYLDDRKFAEGFASARLSGEKFGRTRVIRDLRQRRVAPAVAENTVAKVYEGVDEAAMIEEWIRKKYRLAPREAFLKEDKDLASAYRRLSNAGFRSGDIIRVLKRFAQNPDLLDSFEPPEPAEPE
ncbi:MAG TPA: RecX family transcriptional regulator [Bryobacteraceae bacterium]|jgi:regulatory protein|nr:RecX family transcriptional regulator [Bryobacteraceae bacterium]